MGHRAVVGFSADEVARARRYHRPLEAALVLDAVLGVTVLVLCSFGPAGDPMFGWVDGLPWWAATIAFTALVLAASALIRLPVGYWRGFVHEHRWGFSTQSIGGWLADRAKGLAVGVGLTCVVMLGFLWLARLLPTGWPWVAAPGAAIMVLLLSFVAPVLLEPVFNRFEPLADEGLAAELRAVADRAGVPIRDVLVADASRRTRKENAYVSGLGRTRRVVLFDTLLARSDRGELKLVVAHELGHRRSGHVAKGTAAAMVGAAGAVVVLWALLGVDAILQSVGASGAGDPRVVPFVLLVVTALELAALPPGAAVSRRWERQADRFSLEQTGDAGTFEATHRALAVSNLIDLDPPRPLYVLMATHPTPPQRIAAAREWATAGPRLGATIG